MQNFMRQLLSFKSAHSVAGFAFFKACKLGVPIFIKPSKNRSQLPENHSEPVCYVGHQLWLF